jgi:hypothetical protein
MLILGKQIQTTKGKDTWRANSDELAIKEKEKGNSPSLGHNYKKWREKGAKVCVYRVFRGTHVKVWMGDQGGLGGWRTQPEL